jgi:hypothetical protein
MSTSINMSERKVPCQMKCYDYSFCIPATLLWNYDPGFIDRNLHRDSSVGKAMGYELDGLGWIPGRGEPCLSDGS